MDMLTLLSVRQLICFVVFLALLHALIFGNVTAIIAHLYTNVARYRSRYNNLHEYIRLHDIKDPLKQRLLDHFHAVWLHTRGVDTDEVFRDFPEELQADVCMHLNRTLLSTNPAFAGASPGCLRKLSLKMKFTHSAPGEYIAHQGDPLNRLFFVGSGSLEVLVHNEVMAILGNGDVFGQNFYKDSTLGKAFADVRALSYCDLQYIHRDDLMDTFHMYPNFGPMFSASIDISYDLRLDGRIEKQDVFCNRKSSSFGKRRISTIAEEKELSISPVSNTDGGRRSDARVTFQLGDIAVDLTSEPSDPSIEKAKSRPRDLSLDIKNGGIEGCDSGVATEVHSGQSQVFETVCERANWELQRHMMSRLESRLVKLEVNMKRVIELLEQASVSRFSIRETSL